MPATVRATEASADLPAPRRAEPPAVVDVLLASDLRLVTEAVAAALRSRGFRTTVLGWPQGSDVAHRRQAAAAHAASATLLYDVDVSVRMTAARALLRSWSGPWLVLTGSPRGAAWGGLALAGAAAVRPLDMSLGELDAVLAELAAGGTVEAGVREEEVTAWRSLQEEHGQLQQRLDSLTARQLQVLALLYAGMPVGAIARRLGLAEATVRSQVHAVLRKLGVHSQLAAVALLYAIERSAQRPQSTGERQST